MDSDCVVCSKMAEQVSTSQSTPDTPTIQRGVLKLHKSHNIRAYIDQENNSLRSYRGIMDFLVRSRVYRPITDDVVISSTYVEDFWCSACIQADSDSMSRVIVAKVAGQTVIITEGTVRSILGFLDSESDPVELSREKVRGCLVRCGYPSLDGTVFKKFFCPQFKFLAHIMIHCLGSKKSGFDTMSETLQTAYAALVLNIPFNFSRMVFNYMLENVGSRKEKFLMYPRFIQLIINAQLPDLPVIENDIIVLGHMDDSTVRSMGNYAHSQERPKTVSLFGHLLNTNYQCPPDNLWKHENSDAEDDLVMVEEPEVAAGKRKEREVDEALRAKTAESKSRKKVRLAFKERPKVPTPSSRLHETVTPQPAPAHTSDQPSSTLDQPTSTSSEQPGSTVAVSSTQTDKQVAELQQMMISLLNKFDKQKAEMEDRQKATEDKLKRVEEESAEKIRKLEEENAEIRARLIKETLERERLEALEDRLKVMEDCYDEQSQKMTVDDDGFYRDSAYFDEVLPRRIDGAGASGSGAGTNP